MNEIHSGYPRETYGGLTRPGVNMKDRTVKRKKILIAAVTFHESAQTTGRQTFYTAIGLISTDMFLARSG